MQNTS